MIEITKDNFRSLAINAYDRRRCEGIDDILGDIERFKYLNKLFAIYYSSGDLKERLILNHIITLFNVFGKETIRFLFFKIQSDYFKIMMPFLAFLNRLDDYVEIGGKLVSIEDIGYDKFIAGVLQEL